MFSSLHADVAGDEKADEVGEAAEEEDEAEVAAGTMAGEADPMVKSRVARESGEQDLGQIVTAAFSPTSGGVGHIHVVRCLMSCLRGQTQ